jgi:glutathione S-transferase
MVIRLRGLTIETVEVAMRSDEKGIPHWVLPADSPEAKRLGTREWAAFNPEARVPVLMIGNTMMTQTGAIIEYLEEVETSAPPLLPADPLLRAEARRVMWSIAADGKCIQLCMPTLLSSAPRHSPALSKPAAHHTSNCRFWYEASC